LSIFTDITNQSMCRFYSILCR